MHDVLAPCHERLLSCLLAPYSVLGVLPPMHDGQHLFALEHFFLQQRLRQAVQGLAVLAQDAARLLMGLCYQSLDLGIQALCCHLRVHTLVTFERRLVEGRTPVR